MNRLEAALRRTAADLEKSGHRWALVGGFAVSVRAEPRFTADVDVAVMVDGDRSAEELVRALIATGYDLIGSIEHDNGRLATVRMTNGADGPDVIVDLLFASSGIEPEVARGAEVLEVVSGLSLPVATVGHLIALKLLARDDATRPQDLVDLHGLMAVATAADLTLAKRSVELIEARGFNRGRDLRGALGEMESTLNG